MIFSLSSSHPVLNFFEWGTPQFKLSNEFRWRIFDEVSRSDLPGMVFTYVWALDDHRDKEYVDRVCALFADRGAQVFFVELVADIEERLRRNVSEFRLAQKAPKRDIEKSRRMLIESSTTHKLNTDDDFFYPENHVRIDNRHLTASEAAARVVAELGLVEK